MNTNQNKEIVLFTNMQMWYHKHIIHMMFFFIITGLPLVSSYFSWIAYIIGVPLSTIAGATQSEQILSIGVQVCRILHRFTAILWIFTSIPIVIVMLPKICSWGITPQREKGESWMEYIKKGFVDVKSTYIEWKYPKYMGKYNIAQILAAWAVIFICMLMLVTGILLVFRSSFDPSLMSLTRLLHLAGFVAMILFLIFHIYFAVHPINRAGYIAMFRTGKDSVEHAKKKHPKLFSK